MAIILPNTRNTMGVPNRYSDLAAAGLRWTPPPVYRYDAYDVQGDEATLYEEDIDLADYQYNVDSADAAALPVGYTGVAGGNHDWRWLIGEDTKLYLKQGTAAYCPDDSVTGVTRVAEVFFKTYPQSRLEALVIRNGQLGHVAMYRAHLETEWVFTYSLVDATRTWTEVSFARGHGQRIGCYAIGVADGLLMAVKMPLNIVEDLPPTVVSVLDAYVGWKSAGGVSYVGSVEGGYANGYFSAAIHPNGSLYKIYGISGENGVGFVLNLELADYGTWQSVSGYSYSDRSTFGYPTEYAYHTKRMYGIKNGTLQSIQVEGPRSILPAGRTIITPITECTDWHKVVFIAPDEAVAIRRIAL